MYCAKFDQDWEKYFSKLNHELKERTVKKLKQILIHPYKRHLTKGANFFVAEVGQYRIIYRIFENEQEVRFYFIGNHKQYVQWYSKLF